MVSVTVSCANQKVASFRAWAVYLFARQVPEGDAACRTRLCITANTSVSPLARKTESWTGGQPETEPNGDDRRGLCVDIAEEERRSSKSITQQYARLMICTHERYLMDSIYRWCAAHVCWCCRLAAASPMYHVPYCPLFSPAICSEIDGTNETGGVLYIGEDRSPAPDRAGSAVSLQQQNVGVAKALRRRRRAWTPVFTPTRAPPTPSERTSGVVTACFLLLHLDSFLVVGYYSLAPSFNDARCEMVTTRFPWDMLPLSATTL